MTKIELFECLLEKRIQSYSLQDQGLMSDDQIVMAEEIALNQQGYDYAEYQNWKSGEAV